MQAVVLEQAEGPENLHMREVPTPEPGPGNVRIRVAAAALNRRDYWISTGHYPDIVLPCTTGSDGSGVIDAVGQGVDKAQIGREVVIHPCRNWGDDPAAPQADFEILGMPSQGTFADYICVPSGEVEDRPAHLDWAQSAAVPLAGLTSWRAVMTQGQVQKGQRVLITGAGSGVSTFAMLWCVHQGASVYISSGSQQKIEQALVLGAIAGVNYHDPGCYKTLAGRAGGFDVIIDSAGGNAVNDLLDTLRPGGRFVFFGATLGNPEHGLVMARLFFRQLRIQGTTMGTPDEFRAMLAFLSKHRIVPVIDRVLPLAEVREGYRCLEQFAQMGKIVFQNDAR